MMVATSTERVKLIDAAFRSSNPQAFLCGMQSAFRYDGRYDDFSTAAMLYDLFQKDEIEKLQFLKWQWQQAQ